MKSKDEMFAILNLIGLDEKNPRPHYCTICNRKYKSESACYRHIDNKHDNEIRVKMNQAITGNQ